MIVDYRFLRDFTIKYSHCIHPVSWYIKQQNGILSWLYLQIFTWCWKSDEFNFVSLFSSNDIRRDGSFKIPRFTSVVTLVADADKLSNGETLFDDGDNGVGLKRLSLERPGDKIFKKINKLK